MTQDRIEDLGIMFTNEDTDSFVKLESMDDGVLENENQYFILSGSPDSAAECDNQYTLQSGSSDSTAECDNQYMILSGSSDSSNQCDNQYTQLNGSSESAAEFDNKYFILSGSSDSSNQCDNKYTQLSGSSEAQECEDVKPFGPLSGNATECPTQNCFLHRAGEDQSHSFVAHKSVTDDTCSEILGLKDVVCCLSAGRTSLSSCEDLRFWCNFCPFSSTSKQQLVTHVVTHRFSCQYCTFGAYSRADVISHTVDKHQEFSPTSWSFCTLADDVLKVNVSPVNTTLEDLHRTFVLAGDQFVMPPPQQPPSAQPENPRKRTRFNMSGQFRCWACVHCSFESLCLSTVRAHCEVAHVSMEFSAKWLPVTPDKASYIANLDIARQTFEDACQKEHSEKSGEVKHLEKQPAGSSPVQNTPLSTEENISVSCSETKPVPTEKSTVSAVGNLQEENPYQCSNCEFSAKNVWQMKTHIKQAHPGDPYVARQQHGRYMFFCAMTDCYFSCDKGHNFMNHVAHCCWDWEKSTAISDMVRTTTRNTINFVNTNVPKPKPPAQCRKRASYQCWNCEVSTKYVWQMKTHIKLAHPGDPYVARQQCGRYVFFCAMADCYFSCDKGQNFMNHVAQCCPDWEKSTAISDMVRTSTRNTIIMCVPKLLVRTKTRNTKTFANTENLKRLWHYECHNCGAQTQRIGQMKNHLVLEHTGELFVAKKFGLHSVKVELIVFCAVPECDSTFQFMNHYIEHTHFCLPNIHTSAAMAVNITKSTQKTLNFVKINAALKDDPIVEVTNMKMSASNLGDTRCPYCDFHSPKIMYTKRHVMDVHPREKASYILTWNTNLGETMSAVYYFCPLCPKLDSTLYKKTHQHMATSHKNNN